MAEREDANQKSYRRRSVSESNQDLFNLTGHKNNPRRSYRRRSVLESDQDLVNVAGHKEAPHISYRRQSVSESDHDLLDPPPPSIGLSPIQGAPKYPDSRFNSHPNISSSGFIDESPWRGLGTRLQ